jgi:hypothetical protein
LALSQQQQQLALIQQQGAQATWQGLVEQQAAAEARIARLQVGVARAAAPRTLACAALDSCSDES